MAVIACALATAVLAVHLMARPGRPTPLTNPMDFRAFWCGSRTLLAGGDPYAVTALAQCERAAERADGVARFVAHSTPAPLPPYALLAFAPLAMLPFPLASAVWLLLSVALVVASVVVWRRLTGFSPAVLAAVSIVPVVLISVPLGQLGPLIVALVSGAALALRLGAPRAAAIAALGLAIEPHIGGPLLLALALVERRARRTILLGVIALVALSVATGGELLREYVTNVLPHVARAELPFEWQFALSPMLWR
ncbi:MAG: glycosyltransferase 87 family protein, partial [Candidatus Dormibacteria bacterium]